MVQAKNNKRTILITRFSAVGDVAMTIPLLYSLSETYPMHRFVFISRNRMGQFFVNKPSNLEFKGVEPAHYKGVAGLYRLYKELKAEYSPDTIADLHDVLRTKILRLFFKANRTQTAHIKKGRIEKWKLTHGYIPKGRLLKSTFERYSNVFASIGVPFETKFTSLFNGKADISDFSQILPQKGECKWVGIAPFARHKGKIYPIELMRKVVELLSAKEDIRIICFGNGAEEEQVANTWCHDFKNVISFIGKSDFGGEMRLISNLDLMLSMDSANMHIASLTHTRVISVWGATSPRAGFLGWQQSHDDCIQLELDCRPCSIFGNKPCRYGDYRCMNIPPHDIAEKIIKALDASSTNQQ